MIDNEEDIGVDSPDSGEGISCRVSTTTGKGSKSKFTRIQAEPGNFLRVSLVFQGGRNRGDGFSNIRALVYVDPLTGNGRIRIGEYRNGREYGKQLEYETDTPVWKGNK